MAKIIKADDLEKDKKSKKSGSKIDLGKIKDIIEDNPEAVKKIKEGVTDIITSKVIGGNTKKKATKKTTSKKSSSDSDGLSKVLDLAGSFLKK